MTLEPNTAVSHYKILSAIGKGGMGEVYLAEDTMLDRKVAIKFLNEDLSKDSEKVNRFVQEAKAVSALNHPNILTVHEIGTWEDTRYIATEYIEGETLRDIIRRKDSILLYKVLKIGIQVAEALSAAHRAGIAHRDIKPENIMVREDGYVKVLDFGLAKLTEKKTGDSISLEGATKALVKTNPGVVMGTVSYMSPEQARGQETDARTDIWSLGVVLYEMLSGKAPFGGETTNHTIVAILETEPKLLENVPDELQRIVRKTLTKDKAMRYQNTGDLVIDLKNLRRDLDIQGELERSVVPNSDTETAAAETAGSSTQSGENATADGAQSTQNLTTASSLEYAVNQAKTHKLAFAAVGIILIGLVSATVYLAFFRGVSDRIDSVAVMPFVNESGDESLEYLSDGMAETLINDLSQIPDLSVKARSLVFRYKGKETAPGSLASELGVQAILTGRVVQRGDQVTLSVELIDGRTENTLWGKKYERNASGLTTLQSDLARDVSERLASNFSGEEATSAENGQTKDPAAYQAYLKGRFYWNKRTEDDLQRAIRQFGIAIDRDPNYALAYAGLADCYAILPGYSTMSASETVPLVRANAEKALSLNSRLASPLAALGSASADLWNWSDAEDRYKKAIDLDPGYPTTYHWYSILLHYEGRHDEAAKMIKRAQELDPLSSVIAINITDNYLLQEDTNAALENTLKILEIDPDFVPAFLNLGEIYLRLGRRAEAIAAFEKAVDLTSRGGTELGLLGYGYASVGRRSEALAILEELQDKYDRKAVLGLDVATVYVGLGDNDSAFEWYERDFGNRVPNLPQIRIFGQWQGLRKDPRYFDLLRRMGLPVED